eukprot:283503-Amphidinium_carterae.1
MSTGTGGAVQEKRILLDIADIREWTESGGVQIAWIPTKSMVADSLTKYIPGLRRLASSLLL